MQQPPAAPPGQPAAAPTVPGGDPPLRPQRRGVTHRPAVAAAAPAPTPDYSAWAHRRFEGLTRDLFKANFRVFTTFSGPPAANFEDSWMEFFETWQGPPVTVAEGGDMSALLVLSDPGDIQHQQCMKEFINRLDLLGAECPPVLWVPHTVAPEVRTEQQRNMITTGIIVKELMDVGLDGIVSGEPEGLEMVLQVRCFIARSTALNSKWEHALNERRDRAAYFRYLDECCRVIVWDYLRSRVTPDIPADDPAIPVGLATNVQGCQLGPLLGKGAFASVYRVVNPEGVEGQAMKVVSKTGMQNLKDLKQCQRQIQVERLISSDEHSHPNIIKMHDVYASESHLYFLQEYGGPHNLFKRLKLRDLKAEDPQRRPINTIGHFALICQAVAAVCHLHMGPSVCHRDLKPENFLVEQVGLSYVLKLADFDFAVIMDRTTGVCGTICGTFPFVAPEVVLQKRYSGFVADIWSLGVVLCELHCGISCFEKHYDLSLKKTGAAKDHDRGCTPAVMKKVATALKTSPPSASLLVKAHKPECSEFLPHMLPLLDGMLDVDTESRWQAEAVQALVRKLPIPIT